MRRKRGPEFPPGAAAICMPAPIPSRIPGASADPCALRIAGLTSTGGGWLHARRVACTSPSQGQGQPAGARDKSCGHRLAEQSRPDSGNVRPGLFRSADSHAEPDARHAANHRAGGHPAAPPPRWFSLTPCPPHWRGNSRFALRRTIFLDLSAGRAIFAPTAILPDHAALQQFHLLEPAPARGNPATNGRHRRGQQEQGKK